jgi:hypothetical protein
MPRETSSTPNILDEVEIHVRVNLLGLCRSLFPASTKQLIMAAFRTKGLDCLPGSTPGKIDHDSFLLEVDPFALSFSSDGALPPGSRGSKVI